MLANLRHVRWLLSCEILLLLSIETLALSLLLMTRYDVTRSFIKVSAAHVCMHIQYMRGLAPVLHLIERETEQIVTDLKDRQIEIIALMNSWVFSRLIAENERAGESLAREMDTVAEAEREQGMSPHITLLRFPSPWHAGSSFRVSRTVFFSKASRLHIHNFRHLL